MISIPTTAELYNQIKSSFESELGVSIPETGKNALRTFCKVQAGKMKIYYLAIANLQKNIFADTADPESMGGTLERLGRVKLERSPFAAVAPEYDVTVLGSVGAVIPLNTTFKSDDDSFNPGQLYILDDAFTFTSTSGTVTLRALEAGDVSELQVGDTLTITAPVALVESGATVTAESVAPQEAETTEEYREKVLQAFRLEAQGGAAADYRLWAADVQSVAQSYPYVVAGNLNQINLYVEAVLADSTDGKGTPTTAILDDVEASVEDPTTDRPGRKPLGVFQVNYLPVAIKEIDITIDGFVDLTAAIQTTIEDALESHLDDVRPFIGAIDVLADKNDIFDTNKIISVILAAQPGSVFGTVTLEVNGSPLSTYTFDNGEIPYLNSVTFT